MEPQSRSPAVVPAPQVHAELVELRRRVEELSDRVAALEAGEPRPESALAAAAERAIAASPEQGSGWFWLEHAGVLRRVATISFVLVVALVLRTLTESGIVDPGPGVQLGIGYAVLLMLVGWRNFARSRPGKRVFSICGAVLLCTLVLETHSRLQHLDSTTAHALLAVALLVSAFLGIRHRSPIVVEVGVLAAAATAIAIGFPMPEFHLAAVNLAAAMLAAAAIAPMRRAAWMHWVTLAMLAFFWLLWAVKLHMPLARAETVVAPLRLAWYLPELAGTFAVLLAIAWRQMRRATGGFELLLPALSVAGACGAAGAVVVPWLAAGRALGVVALGLAVLHLALARRQSRAAGGPAPVVSLVLAAAVAFVPGIWLLSGSLTVSLPLWASAALLMAVASGRLGSGGLRLAACGLQVTTTVAAILAGLFRAPPASPWASAAVAMSLAVVAAWHYRWTRGSPPPAGTWYARLSPNDRPGVLTSWAALSALFAGLRVLVHPLLAALPIDVDNAFAGAQSVLMNCIAIALLIAARRTHSRAALGTAVLVAGIGGAKVFGSDMLALHGVPLVLAVFSFGVTAAVGSVALGRWQRPAPAAAT